MRKAARLYICARNPMLAQPLRVMRYDANVLPPGLSHGTVGQDLSVIVRKQRTNITAWSSSIKRWAAVGNEPTAKGESRCLFIDWRGVASDKPHAVVTIGRNHRARRLGTTCIGARYPRNERPSLRRVGCAIDDGGCRSTRVGDSAVGRLLSMVLLTVVGLGDLLLGKQLFDPWL